MFSRSQMSVHGSVVIILFVRLHVVVYGCVTRSYCKGVEHRLRLLRRIFLPKTAEVRGGERTA